MKWPWVSRREAEAAHARANHLSDLLDIVGRERDRAVRRIEETDKRIDRFMEIIVQMKREGYVPQPLPPEEIVAEEFPDKVEAAIGQRSFNPAMERQLRRYAAALLREKMPEEQVAKRILDGDTVEEEALADADDQA